MSSTFLKPQADAHAAIYRFTWVRFLLSLISSQWLMFSFFHQGVMYIELVSVPLVFQEIYGFNTGQSGLVYITQTIGSFVGFGIEAYCNRLYRRHEARKGPEARLFTACECTSIGRQGLTCWADHFLEEKVFGGVLFPIGCWIYAFSSYPQVHWIVPAIGLTFLCECSLLYYRLISILMTTCFRRYRSLPRLCCYVQLSRRFLCTLYVSAIAGRTWLRISHNFRVSLHLTHIFCTLRRCFIRSGRHGLLPEHHRSRLPLVHSENVRKPRNSRSRRFDCRAGINIESHSLHPIPIWI